VLSLSNQGHATLHNIPIAQIVANQEILIVKIKSNYTRGVDFEISPLQIDFEKIVNDKETVAYQFSGLSHIKNELEKIRRTVERKQ
jgi:hypothetical protein